MIETIRSQCYSVLGVNIGQTIKYRIHHRHPLINCRILKVNENIREEVLMPIYENIIDFLGVCAHYSIRFQNSDVFLKDISNDDTIETRVFFLANTPCSTLVSSFLGEYIEPTNLPTHILTWNKILYLWRLFLSKHDMPLVLKMELKDTLLSENSPFKDYRLVDSGSGEVSFVGLTSKYLPIVEQWMAFWEEEIEIVEDTSPFSVLEVDEIGQLFRNWSGQKLGEKQILDLLHFFYPNIRICNDKYICSVISSHWDKVADIKRAMYHQHIENKKHTEDPYVYYCKYYRNKMDPISSKKHLLVSKSYFTMVWEQEQEPRQE